MIRLGVDVGETNTDAALVADGKVLAAAKATTSADITGGIVQVIDAILAPLRFAPSDVDAVVIGTTHFSRALAQRKMLAPTAAIRLGLPATSALPPLAHWPETLRQAIRGQSYLCHGGHDYDGRTFSDFNESEFRNTLALAVQGGARSFAVSSVFSPVSAEFEVRAGQIIAEQLPGSPFSLSHEIGRVGLLQRENATIVNAALRELADHVTTALASTIAASGFRGPIFLSQNDGTLMDIDYARRYPVATFAAGAANAIRGAAFLSNQQDCTVVDVGGSSTGVSVLKNGFPRESSTDVDVADIQMNLRMPHLLSLGIGGSTVVSGGNGHLSIGPKSVGSELENTALIFGGDRVTATDLAVAAGRATIGDPHRTDHLDGKFVQAALEHIELRVAQAVDRMRISSELLPVVVVGGGHFLVPDRLTGSSPVVRPRHIEVANAVGAAVALVGGEVDRVFTMPTSERSSILDAARREAIDRAIAAGAAPDSVRIVASEEVPLGYLPGGVTRVRIKAVGELSLDTINQRHYIGDVFQERLGVDG